jgi:hypothetical protein
LATPGVSHRLDCSDRLTGATKRGTIGAMTNNRLSRSRAARVAALSGFAGHAVYGEPYQRH